MQNDNSAILVYIVGFILGILITYGLCRWIFAIDKRTRQNEIMINLLTLLANKNGATEDDIVLATKTKEEISFMKAKEKRKARK